MSSVNEINLLQGEGADSRSLLVRAATILSHVADLAPTPVGVSEVARQLNLSKAVAHRILKQLTLVGLLHFDLKAKKYRLGGAALALGTAALRSLDAPKIARPFLEKLTHDTGETATLSARMGWHRVYVDQVLSPHEVRMSVSLGTRYPLHAGSSSKAILSGVSDGELEAYLADASLDALTSVTVTDKARLREDIAKSQIRGYTFSLGERQSGAGSVAAPVYAASGDVFGSISICGPVNRFSPEVIERFGPLVAQVARDVSHELGFRSMSQADA